MRWRAAVAAAAIVAGRAAVAAPQGPPPEPAPELRLLLGGTAATLPAALRGDLERFYAALGWRTAWIAAGVPSPQARGLLARFEHAADRGLRAADYDGLLWTERLRALARAQLAGRDRRAELDFDLAVSAATLRYARDLFRGRVDPQTLGFPLPPKSLDAAALLQSLAAAADVEPLLEALEPPFAAYRRLRDALPAYRALAAATPPRLGTRLRPGDRTGDDGALAEELRLLGDLPPEARWATGIYAGALVEAVRRFQARHGLEPDGVVGRATLAALAVPYGRRVEQIELTLERWRWLPRDLSEPTILVNLPEQRLRALRVEGDELVPDLTLRVVVGAAFDHQTPLLVATLSHLLFHPFWNVPERIAREELLPLFRRDPGAFAAEGFELTATTGEDPAVVPPTPENLARLERRELRLRQRPGPRNALGQVKFVFPNRYDVYLHDTPGRAAFGASRRDLSHGCVRVEDALGLARWVLRDQPEGTAEGLRALLDDPAPRRVDVRRPLRVLLLYGTAVATRDGRLLFFEDLYGHDAALGRALRAGPGR